jgi:hypothetical protein
MIPVRLGEATDSGTYDHLHDAEARLREIIRERDAKIEEMAGKILRLKLLLPERSAKGPSAQGAR